MDKREKRRMWGEGEESPPAFSNGEGRWGSAPLLSPEPVGPGWALPWCPWPVPIPGTAGAGPVCAQGARGESSCACQPSVPGSGVIHTALA